MNNYKKGGYPKGGSVFGGKPAFGGSKKFGGPGRGHDRGPRREYGERPMSGGNKELFKAICSSCRVSCEVPFRPSNDKPVYCRECFSASNTNNPSRSSHEREGRGGDVRRDDRQKQSFEFKRAEEAKPIRDTTSEDIKRQLANLEAKIDALCEIVEKQSHAHAQAVSSVVKEVTAEFTPAKAKVPKVKATEVKTVVKKVKKVAEKKEVKKAKTPVKTKTKSKKKVTTK